MLRLQPTTLFLLLLSGVTVPLSTYAETKALTAEATYTMGDGESPSFAEVQVLQRAKQIALEQAGTYVESYTKVHNYDLTNEEIQTIAGGVLEVQVLEKTRTLIGDGLRFYIKIKATVTTDKMEELARRIKGKNVAEEYKKLQEEYARLSKEIETWKQLMARTAPGPEREAALDQIMGREKAFGDVRQREAAFFKRLFSGEALVRSALDERNKLDALLMQIAEQGTQVSIGEPQSHMIAGASDTAKIYVPVTLQTTPAIVETLERTALSLGGQVKRTEYARRSSANSQRNDKGIVIRMGKNEEIARFFQSRVRALTFRVNIILKNGEALSCNTWEENRDIKHPQYFETNPIAQVFGIYDRFRNEDASKQDLVWWLQRKAGALEFEEEPPVLWFSNDEVMILSSSKPDFHKPLLDRPDFNFASIVIGGSSGLAFSQRPPSFGVVAFEYPRNFTVTTQLPLVLANQIKAVTGDFIFSDKVPAQAIQKIVNCNIEP